MIISKTDESTVRYRAVLHSMSLQTEHREPISYVLSDYCNEIHHVRPSGPNAGLLPLDYTTV
jgi:hypothetical protein